MEIAGCPRVEKILIAEVNCRENYSEKQYADRVKNNGNLFFLAKEDEAKRSGMRGKETKNRVWQRIFRK